MDRTQHRKPTGMRNNRPEHSAAASGQDQERPKRRRASKAIVLAEPAAPSGLPALFERAASAANFDVDALTKLMAMKREIEADAERRAFDQDFAALQAELSPVEANAFDAQKRRSYADINALLDVVATRRRRQGLWAELRHRARLDGWNGKGHRQADAQRDRAHGVGRRADGRRRDARRRQHERAAGPRLDADVRP